MRSVLHVGLIIITILLFSTISYAADRDLHKVWDNRCYDCHGHAGEFARQFLKADNGELQGRHHVHDLRRFMDNHYLPSQEVDAVYAMLLAQTQTQARFKNECSRCHQSAANLVRQSLQISNGRLVSRHPGRDVRSFLATHQGMQAGDVDFYMQVLTRVAKEVYNTSQAPTALQK